MAVLPVVLVALWAHLKVRIALGRARRDEASVSGFKAGRTILDQAGLSYVAIEQTPGSMTDHFDSGDTTLRLTEQVYHGRNLAAVAVAAHEAAHAIQQSHACRALALRNIAISAASLGSLLGFVLMLLAMFIDLPLLFLGGMSVFYGVVGLQLVGLPLEWNANRQIEPLLTELGLIEPHQLLAIKAALRAAALMSLASTANPLLAPIWLLKWFARR